MEGPEKGCMREAAEWLRGCLGTAGRILYGATVHGMVRDLRKERSHLEHLFILTVFGDLVGIPVLPPYYTLRLLPYVAPHIGCWRRSMLREKDLTELCGQDLS